MDVRLVQLLASFIGVSADYALARLEYAIKYPEDPPPPVIDRLPDASESALRTSWPRIESQLERATAYVKHLRAAAGKKAAEDHTIGWVRRTTKELDQYARAIRWVMTVTER